MNEFLLVSELTIGLLLCAASLQGAAPQLDVSGSGQEPRRNVAAWAWRVKPKNMSVRPVEAFDGRRRVLEVGFSPKAGSVRNCGRIEFGSADIGLPLGAWIPPYVGVRARRLAYSVRPKTLGDNRVAVKLNKDERAIWKEHLLGMEKWTPGTWNDVSHEISLARGYRQARLDGAAPPPQSGVWYVHERTVARGGENLSFSRDLVRNGIDYEWTDPQELPDVIDRARTVMVSPYIYNKDAMPMLEKWKALGEGRSLITATGSVAEIAAKHDLPRIQIDAAADEATALPFRCGKFAVVALFNRVAAGKADYPRWRRDVFDKVFRRRTYDESNLLFPDFVKGADAGATMPVEAPGRYRVYSVLDDGECVTTVEDGKLRLSLGSRFCDLMYYGLDTPSFREFLARVREQRAVTAEFLE